MIIMPRTYIYLGDRMTVGSLKGVECTAVRNTQGKCIRGRNSNMLVDVNGVKHVVLARRLRILASGV